MLVVASFPRGDQAFLPFSSLVKFLRFIFFSSRVHPGDIFFLRLFLEMAVFWSALYGYVFLLNPKVFPPPPA